MTVTTTTDTVPVVLRYFFPLHYPCSMCRCTDARKLGQTRTLDRQYRCCGRCGTRFSVPWMAKEILERGRSRIILPQ